LIHSYLLISYYLLISFAFSPTPMRFCLVVSSLGSVLGVHVVGDLEQTVLLSAGKRQDTLGAARRHASPDDVATYGADNFVETASNPLHIVFLVMDDLGWNDVGFRSGALSTPTIDTLAKEGVILQNYYVMDACAPTRATFMTGRHVTRTGIYTPFAGTEPEGVPLDEIFLPSVLKKAGYATHMIGKWHLGFYQHLYTPTFRGFDSFYGFYGWGEHYTEHTIAYSQPVEGYDFRDDASPMCGANCSVVDWSANGTYSTHLFARRAVRVINSHDVATPLFLYLAWQAVHAPNQVPAAYEAPFASSPREPIYSGMVAAADEGIANVTAALSARGMLSDTIIVFTTDNGAPIARNSGIGGSNYPLRGGKQSIFEGGVRGVAFVWSRRLAPGEHHGLAHSVDWLPTLAGLAGASTAATKPLDGLDMWPALLGHGVTRERLFLGCNAEMGCAVRDGTWKLIVGKPGSGWSGTDVIVDTVDGWSPADPGDAFTRETYWTTGTNYKNSSQLLFNLADDESERHDLSEQHPEVVTELGRFLWSYTSTKVPLSFVVHPGAPKGRPVDTGGPLPVWGPWFEEV